MDSEYLQNPSFVISQNCISIDKIIIFSTNRAAEVFLEKILPIQSGYLIFSEQGGYPQNTELYGRVLHELQNDSSLRVVSFSTAAIRRLKVKTQRLLCLDGIVSQELKWFDFEQVGKLNLNEHSLVGLIENFFNQWDYLPRANDNSFAINNFREFKKETWLASLLGDV